MFERWRRWRERSVLHRRAIPAPLWADTLRVYPFLAALPEADRTELHRLASLFLSRKEFHGAQGLQVDDAMAVAIAAQACLPILRIGLQAYEGFVGIVVHPDEVQAAREVMDEDGIVHAYEEALSGEAMEGGPVMLAWPDVAAAGWHAEDAYNVVVHEFAHVLDMADGAADGRPVLPTPSARQHWEQVLDAEYRAFCHEVDTDRVDSVLDPYGSEAPEEFFAVASEAFFVQGAALRAERPALYELLRSFYLQDPASR